MRYILGSVALAAALAVSACGGGSINFAALTPQPAKLMVAKKLDVPLFIVLDPAKVQDRYEVDGFGPLEGTQSFVKRDLKNAMAEYFSRVEVVASAAEGKAEKYIVADVRIDRIQKQTVMRAGVGHKILEMNWSFAVRPSDAEEYVFSFAGISQSEAPAKSLTEVGNRLIENSITGLLDEWARAGVFARLRAWADGAPAAAAEGE